MERAVRDLNIETIKACHEKARKMGFAPMDEKPGYDQIGLRGKAAVIERATEKILILPCLIIDKEGRPWVRIKWPRNGFHTDYYNLGWKA